VNTLNNFPYKHALVLGLAKSGMAATRILNEHGIRVRVNELKDEENDQIKALRTLGIEVITGGHPLSVLDGVDVVVKNPGIPYENIIIVEAEKRNIPVITEIEIAGLLAKGPIIGITGSNGKTTTTTLIYEMLKMSGEKVKIAGNIGTVASEVAQSMDEGEKLVIELSSFQLLGIQTFHPKVAVLLNLFEAHLDYHKTLDHYANAKGNIFRNQTEEDYIVFNADDKVVSSLVKNAKAQKIPFSMKDKFKEGAWTDGKTLFYKNKAIIENKDIALVGKHNYENILASVSAASLLGATVEGIREVLQTFQGVPHRLQFVKEIDGRVFYNNSKATNILATTTALASFDRPIILLAGGLDRGNGFDGLIPYLNNVKAMILFGQTREKLRETGEKAGIEHIYMVDNVEQAVKIAYDISAKGDVILLSPACASWDQYRSFEERGDMFVKTVHKL
jgi:UDP-N-acetylmuramoylalanine--D-glutamate ligase